MREGDVFADTQTLHSSLSLSLSVQVLFYMNISSL